MNAVQALRAMMGGVFARLRGDAYVPVTDTLAPLSWYGYAPGATGDYASDQRYVRPIDVHTTQPYPGDGQYGVSNPFNSIQPCFDIYAVLDNAHTRLPSGPYTGSARGVNIVGGMGWGPQDINGLIKQMGEG
jgi:hypothetical protein